MKPLPFLLFVSGLTGVFCLGLFSSTIAEARSIKRFTVDVACDAGTVGFNSVEEDAPNAPRGNVIMIGGDILPKGSLDDPDFDPSSVDRLGVWRCHFVELGDMFDFPLRGAVTYFFQFGATEEGSEKGMIMVQGLNSHRDPGDAVPRRFAVVGGTGKYFGVTGEVVEEVLRRNETGCFDARFHFRILGVPGFKRDDDKDKDDD